MYIEGDYVNKNMDYETISEDKMMSEEEMMFEDEIENKNIKNNDVKTENIANFLRINQNPKNDVEIICIQPLHSRERLKRKLKTKNENNKKKKKDITLK